MRIWRPKAANQARKEGDWQVLLDELEALLSPEDVDRHWTDFLLHRARHLPADWAENYRDACEDRRDELTAANKHRDLDAEYRAVTS